MLDQTFNDFELWFLDDASSDSTLDIVKSFQDPRISVLRNEEWLGIPRSLNRLLNKLQGEFWAHMDADDLCMPHRLEAQLELMRHDPAICVCGCVYHMLSPGGTTYLINLPLNNDDIRASILFFSPVAHPFATLRGEFFRRNNIKYAENMKYSIDYELWTRIALQYPEAGFLNCGESLGLYRRHEQQISTSKLKEQAQMATNAQMQVFTALGFSPGDKLIRAHRFIYHSMPVSRPEWFDEILAWCTVLKRANDCKGLFPLRQFTKNLAQRLLQAASSSPQLTAGHLKLLERWLRLYNELDADANSPAFPAGKAGNP